MVLPLDIVSASGHPKSYKNNQFSQLGLWT